MAYNKKIICLANSRKTSGRCIAGKELTDTGVGDWIRPVSKRETQEISEDDRRYEDGTRPAVLDVITIPCIKHSPHSCQQENHLIDDQFYWEKAGQYSVDTLEDLIDTIGGPLWRNDSSTFNGVNDQISIQHAAALNSSLVLVKPEGLIISVATEGARFNNPKRRVRARFHLNGHQYKLMVTDPRVEADFLKRDNGQYHVESEPVYMCISISEPFHGFCYKLVASIIGLTD